MTLTRIQGSPVQKGWQRLLQKYSLQQRCKGVGDRYRHVL
jgi:hypothetical protein